MDTNKVQREIYKKISEEKSDQPVPESDGKTLQEATDPDKLPEI